MHAADIQGYHGHIVKKLRQTRLPVEPRFKRSAKGLGQLVRYIEARVRFIEGK